MRVYYRIMRGGKSLYGRVISWYTRSPYQHAEFAWPLNNPRARAWLGAQSSKISGVPSGVQIRPRDYLDPTEFDLFCVDVAPPQFRLLRGFLEAQIGKPYDFKAIFNMGSFVPRDVTTTKRWFCSELVFFGFRQAGVELLRAPLKQSDRITPRDLSISTVAKIVE